MEKGKIDNKVGTIAIAILTGILVVFVIALVYVIYLKTTEEKIKDVPIVEEKIDIDTLYASITGDALIGNFEDYYKEEKITNNIILSLALKNLNINESSLEIKEQEIDNKIKEIFGDSIIYSHSSFTYGCGTYEYNKESKTYKATNIKCTADDVPKEYFLTKKGTVYENDNTLIIYEKVLYLEGRKINDNEHKMEIAISSDYSKQKPLDIVYANSYQDIVFTDYENFATMYKYTFVKQNDNYYFKNFSK